MKISAISTLGNVSLYDNVSGAGDVKKSLSRQSADINLNLSPMNVRPLKTSVSFGELMRPYKKAMLLIVDGFGENRATDPNSPLNEAKTPYLDSLKRNDNGFTLYREIGAAGEYVGLDKKEVGNSEVGHSNIGTGRKVKQAIVRIDESIEDGSFKTNPAFLKAIEHVKENNSTLHIMGALGYSHTHTKFEHYVELIKLAREHNVENLSMHIFTNGEGPTQTSSLEYVQNLNKVLDEYGYPPVSTIIGRNIVMDKSGKWDRIEKAYDALTDGSGDLHAKDVTTGLNDLFKLNVQGLEMPPIIREGSRRIQDNDAVIFANYRADRAIEITSAMTQYDTEAPFMRDRKSLDNLYFVCMTRYQDNFNLPVAFDNEIQEDTLLEILSDNGFRCSTVAQKEKSAHTDFFLNGSRNTQFANVRNYIIPPNSDTSDPELNLPMVCDRIIHDLNSDDVDFIVTNFANSDIIGHKGDYDLAVKGIEVIDKHIKEVVEEAIKNDVAVVITADHGNIEEPQHTKHTSNKVPCYIILPKHKSEIYKIGNVTVSDDANAALQDIAPTLLDMVGENKSDKMTGHSLIIEA